MCIYQCCLFNLQENLANVQRMLTTVSQAKGQLGGFISYAVNDLAQLEGRKSVLMSQLSLGADKGGGSDPLAAPEFIKPY